MTITPRSPACWLFLSTLLLLSSCIRMTRQRIVTYSDPGRDRFELLLFSEGVCRSDSNQVDENEVKRFLDGDGFVVGGWPFQLFKDPIRQEAKNPERPEYGKLAKLLAESFRTIHLGHYLDHHNEISVAQRVIFTNVSELLKQVNAVAPVVLRQWLERDKNWLAALPRTRKALDAAADTEFEWVIIDGHSLILQVPVDAQEWPKSRPKVLADLQHAPVSFAIRTAEGTLPEGSLPTALTIEEHLADEVPRIRIRLGSPRRTTAVHYRGHGRYKPNLEKTIRKLIPDDWDVELADAMFAHGIGRRTRALAGDHELGPLLARIPIEDRVRALLRSIGRDDVDRASVAKLLALLATRWNANGSEPKAPVAAPDAELTDAMIEGWWRWYRRVCEPGPG